MRVISYNIRLGLESSLRAVGEVLQKASPDLVALQEVGRHWVMGEQGDQVAVLGRQTGLRHQAFGPALRIHPCARPWTSSSTGLPPRSLVLLTSPGPLARSVKNQIAWYGVGLLSRWPILERYVVPLPRIRDEQRVVLLVRVATPAGPLLVAVAHLAVQEPEREAQARAVAALLRAHEPLPLLLMGDLNDSPDSRTLEALRNIGLRDVFREAASDDDGATFPSRMPLHRLDYVLLSRGSLRPSSFEVIDVAASDHRPVMADLVNDELGH